jgi:hypothetical protein
MFLLTIIILFTAVFIFGSINVNNGLSHKIMLKPGQEATEIISIVNSGEEPVKVTLYKKDYFYYFENSKQLTSYSSPSSLAQSNADWISIQIPEVLIPSGEESNIPFTVSAPNQSSLKGTYWSMIMIEPSAVESEVSKGKITIKNTIRYGIQVSTTVGVPEAGDKKIEILSRALSKDGEANYLQLVLKNIGIFSLNPSITMRTYDNETGSLTGEFEGNSGFLYPGTSRLYTIPFEGLKPGKYKIVVLIQDGDDVWGAQYNANLM